MRTEAKGDDVQTEINIADYDTTDWEPLNAGSGMLAFQPGFILWHESTTTPRDLFHAGIEYGREDFADRYVDRLRGRLSGAAV